MWGRTPGSEVDKVRGIEAVALWAARELGGVGLGDSRASDKVVAPPLPDWVGVSLFDGAQVPEISRQMHR